MAIPLYHQKREMRQWTRSRRIPLWSDGVDQMRSVVLLIELAAKHVFIYICVPKEIPGKGMK
jgi:hypothetical protein